MANVSIIGLDLARNVSEVTSIGAAGNVLVGRKLRRGEVAAFFAGIPSWRRARR